MTERMLVLLRHAKAATATGVTSDADRPLSGRGYADAVAAGTWLGNNGLRPDLVICSPARRTRQTWQAVSAALTETVETAGPGTSDPGLVEAGTTGMTKTGTGTVGKERAPAVRYEQAAYRGGPVELLDLVRSAPDDVYAILLIGHNPTISEVSALLDPDTGMDSDGLRTCGIAVHRDAGQWTEFGVSRAPIARSHTARG